jgi:hypothetical protein
MSEFDSRIDYAAGHRKWLWHFDGRKTDWRLDVRTGDSDERRLQSDLDDSKLHHYLRMGAIHADIEEEKERAIPVGRKATVAMWLLAFAALWLVCRLIVL